MNQVTPQHAPPSAPEPSAPAGSFSSYRSSLAQVAAADVPKLAAALDSLVIHAWATWNNHDRKMEVLLNGSATTGVTFVGLNADEPDNFQFLRDNGVMNLPCLICFKDGHAAATRIGLFPDSGKLDEFLRETFAR